MTNFGRKSKEGGWSASGKLITGGNGSFTLQEEFKSDAHGGAKVYTVQFDVDSEFPVEATAEISWAVEGNSSQRTVSIVNGTSISGPMEAIRVIVRDASLVAPLGLEYTVTVNVAPGTRPASYCPPILRGREEVALPPGASTNVAVPYTAGANSILVTATASNAIAPPDLTKLKARLYGGGGDSTVVWMPLYQPMWLPIPPRSIGLQLTNTAAADDNFSASVMFGIDG